MELEQVIRAIDAGSYRYLPDQQKCRVIVGADAIWITHDAKVSLGANPRPLDYISLFGLGEVFMRRIRDRDHRFALSRRR